MSKILICDDDIEICKTIEKFLSAKGFQVALAHTAEEGLFMLSKEKFDLLIQDKKMPGIGGFGVLREMRARKDSTPVIILTGYLDKLDAETQEIIELGFVDLLLKPIELDVLVKKIHSRLKGAVEL